jgi:hypothetical protein
MTAYDAAFRWRLATEPFKRDGLTSSRPDGLVMWLDGMTVIVTAAATALLLDVAVCSSQRH